MAIRIVLIVIASILIAVMAVVGLIVLGFCLLPATIVDRADVSITVMDSAGNPVPNLPIELWEYDMSTQHQTTDSRGVARFEDQSYKYSKAIINFWVDRPAEFVVRFRIPDRSQLYYRTHVTTTGQPTYHVFNDKYDYFFGEKWIGEFDDHERLRDTVSDMGKTYPAVAPNTPDQSVPLWHIDATVSEATNPDSAHQVALTLKPQSKWHQPVEEKDPASR